MTSTLTSKVLLAGAALLSAYGCSGSVTRNHDGPATAGSGQATAGDGVGASSDSGGSGTIRAGSSAGGYGTTTAGTDAGGSGTTSGGAETSTAGNDTGATSGTGGDSGAGGASGAGGGSGRPITDHWPSNGCGKQYLGPSGDTQGTLPTQGAKDAACNDKLANGTPRCGLWGQVGSAWLSEPLVRDYYVYLPEAYDSSKVYPLVFQGPGCGGNGTQIYPLNDGTAPNVGNSVIRIGLTPASTDVIGHGCCPFGCFDDKEGDDSVDFVFYENLYDKLNEELCFDRNRVFAAGNSSGAWLANELACKYAGDALRPVRAPLANTGSLPIPAAERPTCTSAPMAGMWVQESNDPDATFVGAKVPINRAMQLNQCLATSYESAVKVNFPIGGGIADDVCKLITDCNPLYPLVYCELPGNAHGSHDTVVNPGFSTFLKLFSMAPYLTQ